MDGLDQTFGSYQIVRLLGKGGMGSVYEARHTTLERRAAIKVLHKEFCEDPEVLKRFMNEARAVNIIAHAALVSVSEFGQTKEGAPYIVMEYIDGITLREYIRRAGGHLSVDQVVRLSRQIASALAAAHAKKIVHRDLKPVKTSSHRQRAIGLPQTEWQRDGRMYDPWSVPSLRSELCSAL
ncbi:MAG: serine/threonine-protein kinase [Polyangia bacterium]